MNNSNKKVYVDRSLYKFGNMIMCHMFSESLEDLHTMAKKIGVQRKHFQNKPGFPHYDICKSKRKLAVKHGAIEADKEVLKRFFAIRRKSINAREISIS